MTRRRRGDHPLCVHVIYGHKWTEPHTCWSQDAGLLKGSHPVLALKPRDFAPGRYDWSVVTGLQVCVFDQDTPRRVRLGDGPPAQWWHEPLYALAGEIARYAADVEIYSSVLDNGRWSVRELAAVAHRDNGRAWPHWWSAEIETKNAERIRTWADIVFDRKRGLAAAIAA